mgnify:CR=1 FL=1
MDGTKTLLGILAAAVITIEALTPNYAIIDHFVNSLIGSTQEVEVATAQEEETKKQDFYDSYGDTIVIEREIEGTTYEIINPKINGAFRISADIRKKGNTGEGINISYEKIMSPSSPDEIRETEIWMRGQPSSYCLSDTELRNFPLDGIVDSTYQTTEGFKFSPQFMEAKYGKVRSESSKGTIIPQKLQEKFELYTSLLEPLLEEGI